LQIFLSQHTRALIELPRDHGKSVQVCIRVLWELGRQPSLRAKIICASEELAEERGRFIRDAIATNPRLHLVFPHLRPDRPWEPGRFSIVRPGRLIGPSVASLGIEAASTGARADLLICDDVVDVKALRSRADRERVTATFRENLVNLLEPDGRLWCLFTPWHEADLNAHLKESGAYVHFRRAIGPNFEPVWPEKWSSTKLAQRRAEIGEVAFARGYQLVCVADGATSIRPEWIQFWNEPRQYERIVVAVDPAATANDRSDASALVVLGLCDNRVDCLAAVPHRVCAPELVRLIEAADERWHPDTILFESNAAFRTMHDLLKVHTRFGPKLQAITQSKNKRDRIQSFGIHIESGRFRLQGDGPGVHPTQRALFDEMTTFPFAAHDDLVDAAAFGTDDLLRQPSPRVW
jgi:predicted phage terminase large subunit-like protein